MAYTCPSCNQRCFDVGDEYEENKGDDAFIADSDGEVIAGYEPGSAVNADVVISASEECPNCEANVEVMVEGNVTFTIDGK